MTISELTLKSSDHEPARRFEVFTGSGRQREWLPEEKARIVGKRPFGAVFRRPVKGATLPRRFFAGGWIAVCTQAQT